MNSGRLVDAILVTGAGRRVGLHLAERFLASGRAVIAHSHRETEGISELRRRGARCITADLTDGDELSSLIEFVHYQVQSLRGVIHNASIFEETSEERDVAVRQLRHMLDIHAVAPFIINNSCLNLLRSCREENADIVHITDIYVENPNYKFDVYCASKACAQNLALSFAKRFAPKVKVNIIQPGPIMFQEWHDEEARRRIVDQTLLKKEGGVEAIGIAVEAILANHYQTGAVIVVDGGRHIA